MSYIYSLGCAVIISHTTLINGLLLTVYLTSTFAIICALVVWELY